MQTIFNLKQICFQKKSKKNYNKFIEVVYYDLGYFSSLAIAEKNVADAVNQEQDWNYIYCYQIEEHPIDMNIGDCFLSVRTYLPDGIKMDECLVPEDRRANDENPQLPEFLGRLSSQIRFQIGDIVEVLIGDCVSLEIVGNLPLSPEIVEQIYKRQLDKLGQKLLDSSDDCYITIDKDGSHSHPSCVNLFPPRFPISECMKKQLLDNEIIFNISSKIG